MVNRKPEPPRRLISVRSTAILALSLSIGIMAGVLSWSAKSSIQVALLSGFAGFVAAVSLINQITK